MWRAINEEREAYGNIVSYQQYEAAHNGSNIASNITHPKKNLLTWHVFNERDGWSNIICYCNITHPKAK